MYDDLIKEINNTIKNEGLVKYLKNWKEIKNKKIKNKEEFISFINKQLKKFHKHSMIVLNNKEEEESYNSRQLPKFYWDNKNKIGRITFFHFYMGSNEKQNMKDELMIIQLTRYYIDLWKKKKINGLIIDLRKHIGGSFYPFTMSLAPILINTTIFGWNKKIVNKKDECWINFDENMNLSYNKKFKTKKLFCNFPIAVILSNKTASAGEFSAAIFKGRDNTKFFGQRSKGLLSVNTTRNINDNIKIVFPTKYLTSVDGFFYKKEYLDVDINTNKPILYSKKWILDNI